MCTRKALSVFAIPALLVVTSCGSKGTPKKKTTLTGPPVQMVLEYMQKLIPGLVPKLDVVEGLAKNFQTQITKQDKEGLTMVSINHKGRYNANGPVIDMTITFRGAHVPGSDEELLRYMDGLMRAAGYSPEEAGRIAGITYNMPNPQKDGDQLTRIYMQGGAYLAFIDSRRAYVPFVTVNTKPKPPAP